jgi:hypothetical protein
MNRPSCAALASWPARVAAVVYGRVEWFALSRSRSVDGLAALQRTLSRR